MCRVLNAIFNGGDIVRKYKDFYNYDTRRCQANSKKTIILGKNTSDFDSSTGKSSSYWLLFTFLHFSIFGNALDIFVGRRAGARRLDRLDLNRACSLFCLIELFGCLPAQRFAALRRSSSRQSGKNAMPATHNVPTDIPPHRAKIKTNYSKACGLRCSFLRSAKLISSLW